MADLEAVDAGDLTALLKLLEQQSERLSAEISATSQRFLRLRRRKALIDELIRLIKRLLQSEEVTAVSGTIEFGPETPA